MNGLNVGVMRRSVVVNDANVPVGSNRELQATVTRPGERLREMGIEPSAVRGVLGALREAGLEPKQMRPTMGAVMRMAFNRGDERAGDRVEEFLREEVELDEDQMRLVRGMADRIASSREDHDDRDRSRRQEHPRRNHDEERERHRPEDGDDHDHHDGDHHHGDEDGDHDE